MNIHWLAGFTLTAAACALLYLASPQQRLRDTPLPAGRTRLLAGVLWLLALWLLWQVMQKLPAVFVLTVWSMLLLTLLPFLAVLPAVMRRRRHEKH